MINPHPLLTEIAAQAQTRVNAETAVVALAEDEGKTVYYAAAVGKHAGAIAERRGQKETSGLCGITFQEQQPILVCQTGGDSRVRQDQVKALDIETALAVPLIHEGRLLGALMVLNRMNGTPMTRMQSRL